MKVFITGASGYIGGAVAAALIARGDEVSGLARSEASAGALRERGIAPVIGTLDAAHVLAKAAREADVAISAANGFTHTPAPSIAGTRAHGESVEAVFDEDTPYTPTPQRAARVAIDQMVRDAARDNLRAVVIAPSLLYGRGTGANPHSIQVPWLIALAKKAGVAKHIGSGENCWANVHIDDLVRLYLAAADKAPAGAFYFAENGESSMRETCEAISRMLGFGGRTQSMTVDEAAAEWGEGPANDTMGSNSRVRAKRARAELKRQPRERSLIEEIARGCYAEANPKP